MRKLLASLARVKWLNTIAVVLFVLALAVASYAVLVPAVATIALVLGIGGLVFATLGLNS